MESIFSINDFGNLRRVPFVVRRKVHVPPKISDNARRSLIGRSRPFTITIVVTEPRRLSAPRVVETGLRPRSRISRTGNGGLSGVKPR